MDWYYTLLSISGFLVISQICVDFIVKNVFKDGRTNCHRLFRNILLAVSIVAIVMTVSTTALLQHKREERSIGDRRNFDLQINALRASQTNLNDTIQQRSHTIRDLQERVELQSSTIESLNLILATNKAMDFQTRLALVEARKKTIILNTNEVDLDSLVFEYNTKRAISVNKRDAVQQKELEMLQEAVQIIGPVFTESVEIFKKMLAKLTQASGDNVTMVSNYESWPLNVSNMVDFAEFSTGASNGWNFVFNFDNSKSYGYPGGPCPPYLFIRAKDKNSKTFLRINAEYGQIHYYFESIDPTPVNILIAPTNDFRTPLREYLKEIIAEQASQVQKHRRK